AAAPTPPPQQGSSDPVARPEPSHPAPYNDDDRSRGENRGSRGSGRSSQGRGRRDGTGRSGSRERENGGDRDSGGAARRSRRGGRGRGGRSRRPQLESGGSGGGEGRGEYNEVRRFKEPASAGPERQNSPAATTPAPTRAPEPQPQGGDEGESFWSRVKRGLTGA